MATRFAAFVLAIAVLIYFHPGTEYPYISYTPGLAKFYLSKQIPYHDVVWATSEMQKETASFDITKPNIILIIADDLGFNDLSGGAGIQTPFIDSIKNQGVDFTFAYAGHATCSPARASIMTGRYPTRFGYESLPVPTILSWILSRPDKANARQPIFHYDLVSQVPSADKMMIPVSEVMISDVLRGVNYSTAYVGKWHLGGSKGMLPEDRFDETVSFTEGAAMYAYPPNQPGIVNARLADPLDGYLWINMFDFVQHNGTGRFHLPKGKYMTDYLAEQAAAAIQTKLSPSSSKDAVVPPLFMTVSFNAPHTPLQAKQDDYDAPDLSSLPHKERVYAAMIKALDRGVGKILDALKETGQENNTLVIFTSDNGGPGYLGMPNVNYPLRGWKATFFEGGFRVPLYMQWPTVFGKERQVFRRPVSHVDIFATVAAAAGAVTKVEQMKRQGRVYDGVDPVPYVLAQQKYDQQLKQLEQQQQACKGESDQCLTSVDSTSEIPEAYLQDPHESLFWRTGSYSVLRQHQWKLQVSLLPDHVWLIDIPADESERFNLAEGLKWSTLRDNALRAGGDGVGIEECIEALQSLAISVATETAQTQAWRRDAEVQSTLCSVGRRLLDVDAEQGKPMWPALAEMPMPVDTATAMVDSIDDEYVYWPL